MWTLLLLVAIIFISITVFINQKKFGAIPKGERLAKIEKMPNYKNGEFRNLADTLIFPGGGMSIGKAFKLFTTKVENRRPEKEIPNVKTDLSQLNPDEDLLIWLGHSSVFMQLSGKKILLDPVLNGNAAPFWFMIKAFEGSDWFKADNMPEIDLLIITHDHWDHLDYKTISKLKPKIKQIVCPLGVGAHFERWGFDMSKVAELYWYEKIDLYGNWEIIATPAQHFSGRAFKRNKSLWSSYVINSPSKQVFFSGDSGYGAHFKEIGNKYGSFDLAILELGQYNENWKYIHMLPEQFFTAADDLKTQKVMGIHNSKFALSRHPWNEPLIKAKSYSLNQNISFLTPMIGEVVQICDSTQKFSEWWNIF